MSITDVREHNRAVWSAGNWDEMSRLIAPVGPALLDRIEAVRPGARLLDVGTGSGGTVAIPAAQRGAEVTGLDLTDAWFAAARERADAAGVQIEWVEGDAAELPFAEDSFDMVTSTFGHMFAPDHAAAARELARVCRPGGAIGLCCWTPEGTVGGFFATLSSHLPPPPPGFQPPPLWGAEAHVRELLEPLGVDVDLRRETVRMDFESPEAQIAFMERNFGPLVTARAGLGDRWSAVRAELIAYAESTNEATDGSMTVHNEYLEVVGRLRG